MAASKKYEPIDWFAHPSGGLRWRGAKEFLNSLPTDKDRMETIDALCMKYPTWFFEFLTEVALGENTELAEFQIKYLLDDSRLRYMNKPRQAGGSLVMSMDKLFKAYTTEDYNCDVVSITRSEAQGKIKYIRSLWESLPMRWRVPLTVDNTQQIGFHEGRKRSTIRSIAASAGVRGGKKDIVFDEAAHIPNFDVSFVAALPATIRGAGRMEVTSTPLGKRGKFFEIFENPIGPDGKRRYDDWSIHNFAWFDVPFFSTDIHEARRRWVEDYEESPTFLWDLLEEFGTPEIKSIVYNLTTEEYHQEFCGVFVDESSSFFPYDLIEPARKSEETEDKLEKWYQRPRKNQNVVAMGIDFAQGKKGGDSTSIQVVEFDEKKGLTKHRFYDDLSYETGHNSFDKQLGRIRELIEKFQPTKVRVDGTGMGIKLAEDLKNDYGALIEVVVFNNHNKEMMALNLKTMFEKQNIWILYENERLRGQIHNIQRKVSASGLTQYSGEPHDDMFWALALACKNDAFRRFRILTLDGTIE